MNDSKYKWILRLIVVVIICTITIQAFWNYKNYLVNKQQFVNDVQISLDKAVDDYYADLAEKTTVGFSFSDDSQKDIFGDNSDFFKMLGKIDESNKEFKNLDSINPNKIKGISIFKGLKADSLINASQRENRLPTWDSVNKTKISLLTSKVLVSIHNDTLVLKKVDSLLAIELKRKKIFVNYNLNYNDGKNKRLKSFLSPNKKEEKPKESNLLTTYSKSTFLPKNSELSLSFKNASQQILKRSFIGILISTLLILAVISSLFYLLKIIRNQKQLAEVKNDLISNITHEFKTPIATIGVALESIQSFNVIDDKEKTKKYLNISTTQLSKLNTMVEKLLETATLDSENLELHKDNYNISELITIIAEKHKLQNSNKLIEYSIPENIFANVDVFHFENAVNNIIDNAFKYGGDTIFIDLKNSDTTLNISISDNGNSLKKVDKERIFEKFYRVSKGNTHDVKGFGIGLYYSKKIIEKHHGTLTLALTNTLTTFNITLPNV